MQEQFITDLQHYATKSENVMDCGSINWNFVDADMFPKWSVLLDGETYTTMFDDAADTIELIKGFEIDMDDGA